MRIAKGLLSYVMEEKQVGIEEIKDKITVGAVNALGSGRKGIDVKHLLLVALTGELVDLARKDIKKGKLHPELPYILKPNAERLIKAWRANKITSKALVRYKITDDELVGVMRDALGKLGFKEIVEEPTVVNPTTAE